MLCIVVHTKYIVSIFVVELYDIKNVIKDFRGVTRIFPLSNNNFSEIQRFLRFFLQKNITNFFFVYISLFDLY